MVYFASEQHLHATVITLPVNIARCIKICVSFKLTVIMAFHRRMRLTFIASLIVNLMRFVIILIKFLCIM